MTTNTSATGGYLLPATPTPLPGGLTFDQFLQQVLVGVSGLPGDLVRPRWQPEPPKEPLDLAVNWMSFGVTEIDSDPFVYNSLDSSNNNVVQRMEQLLVECSFYGPQAASYGKTVREGLQIGQNREVLQSAKMDFSYSDKMIHGPDLVNEHWVNRWLLTLHLTREILLVYPILTLLSVSGTLYTLNGSKKTIPFVGEDI